jgi:membrane protein insertase Oxa1/YidC/SpoIIIJ
MMMIMPIMFTALFISAQSGLMLYWLTSIVVGIGQQFFINNYWSANDTEDAEEQPGRSRNLQDRIMREGLQKIVSLDETIAAISTPRRP